MNVEEASKIVIRPHITEKTFAMVENESKVCFIVEKTASKPNIIEAIKYAKKCKSTVLSVVGKNDGYSYKNSDVCVFIPVSDKKKVTPVSEAYQAVVWHLMVSHPILQKNKTKW